MVCFLSAQNVFARRFRAKGRKLNFTVQKTVMLEFILASADRSFNYLQCFRRKATHSPLIVFGRCLKVWILPVFLNLNMSF